MTNPQELLTHAVARNAPITLCFPSVGSNHPHRSRLLGIAETGLFVESLAPHAQIIEQVIRERHPAHVSFRHETQNVEFATPVTEQLRDFKLNADLQIQALQLTMPTQLKLVQRRNDYRVCVATDSDVAFRFHRLSETADLLAQPAGTTEMLIDVRDFSAGGLGGIWKRRKGDSPSLANQQRIRVDISQGDAVLTLDARLRFLQQIPNTDNSRIGLQFILSPTQPGDRQKATGLNKMLSELQRLELRRKKLSR
jgi:c-di-GMP-binding flagellar brake protein YcgR